MARAVLGMLEAVVLSVVLVLAAAWIVLLVVITLIARLVVAVAHDPNAGPYRQVR